METLWGICKTYENAMPPSSAPVSSLDLCICIVFYHGSPSLNFNLFISRGKEIYYFWHISNDFTCFRWWQATLHEILDTHVWEWNRHAPRPSPRHGCQGGSGGLVFGWRGWECLVSGSSSNLIIYVIQSTTTTSNHPTWHFRSQKYNLNRFMCRTSRFHV